MSSMDKQPLTGSGKGSEPWYRWVRMVRTRPRLFVSVAVGLAVIVVLEIFAADWRIATRSLVAWDISIALYLMLTFRLMNHCDVNRIKRRSAHQDEGRLTILALVVGSALASLLAILAELGGANRHPVHLSFAVITILLSWSFTHTIFAIHYTHEYYNARAQPGGGLAFPGQEPPDYWDFMYFSFVIGMTSQVSDVAVTVSSMRRLVTVHGVVSFVFNATIVALTVNIAAGAL